jgi:hypothetical protein
MTLSFTHLLLNKTNSTHKSTLTVSAHNHTYMYIVNWKKTTRNSSKTMKESFLYCFLVFIVSVFFSVSLFVSLNKSEDIGENCVCHLFYYYLISWLTLNWNSLGPLINCYDYFNNNRDYIFLIFIVQNYSTWVKFQYSHSCLNYLNWVWFFFNWLCTCMYGCGRRL